MPFPASLLPALAPCVGVSLSHLNPFPPSLPRCIQLSSSPLQARLYPCLYPRLYLPPASFRKVLVAFFRCS